jgi:hypothetical protein
MKALFTLLAILFFAAPAFAGEAIEQLQLNNGCYQYTLCKAEAGGGAAADCTDTNGDFYVATFSNGYSHTLFAEASTATGFTCTVRAARDAWSATLHGTTSPAITVTRAAEIAPFDAQLGKFWLNCDIDDNAVTVYVRSCPLTK